MTTLSEYIVCRNFYAATLGKYHICAAGGGLIEGEEIGARRGTYSSRKSAQAACAELNAGIDAIPREEMCRVLITPRDKNA